MKINITKKQYKHLVELLYLGEWMTNAAKEADERNEEYDELFQYFCSFSKDFGMKDVINYDNGLDGYYPTLEFEESMDPYIDYYDNDTFWQELTSRLAHNKLSMQDEKFTTHDDFMKKLWETEEKYEIEFENNGIKNVEVKGLK